MTRALSAVAAAVGVAPYRSLRWFGGVLGAIAGSVLRIRRRHVESAMERARIDPRYARSMYHSLGAGLVELLWLAARGRRAPLATFARMDDGSRAMVEAARARGKGIVFGASHTGNWDLAACAIAQEVPLLVVTKNLRIGVLDRFWQTTRAAFGVKLTTAERALAKGRAHLRTGGAVAMMIDQVPLKRRHGLRGPFLGADAWLDRGPATLAARTGAPLVVAASRRGTGGVHELAALRMLVPPAAAGADWIAAATREAAEALEAFVRAHPESWLWLHRRWNEPRH